MSDNMNDFNSYSSPDSGYDTVSGVDTVPKKKGGKIAAIGAAAVVAAGGAGAAAYALSPVVKNQVKLRVSSPESYYTWVTEENSRTLAQIMSSGYSKALDRMKNGVSTDLTVKYVASNDARTFLLEKFIGSDYEDYADDEDAGQFIDIIKNLDTIQLGMNGRTSNGKVNGSMSAELNGNKLLTLDMAMDYTDMSEFIRIPELTERWLGVSLNDILADAAYDEETTAIMDAYKSFLTSPESFLTPEELETEVQRYVDVWNKNIDDVQEEKSQDVAISDITVSYTVLTVKLDNEKMQEISRSFLDELKNDEIIKGIVVDKIGALSAEDYASKLDEAANDIDVDSTDVTIDTYVDAKGIIRGISIEEKDGSFTAICGQDGSTVCGNVSFSEDGAEEFSALLRADENGDKYTGTIEFSGKEDNSFSVEFTDFEIVDKDNGTFNADVSLLIPNEAPVQLNFAGTANSQEVSGDLNINDTNYGRIVVTSTVTEGASVEIPDKSSAFMVDFDSDGLDIEDYVSEDEAKSFLDDLLKKTGISDEYAKAGAEAFASGMFGHSGGYSDYSGSYDSEDWDFDDENWDIDDEDLDDDDWDLDDDYSSVNPYFADAVAAKEGQAYMVVMDAETFSYYVGEPYGTLSYNAVNADVDKDGTYTLKVTADTDGFRYENNGDLPKGISILGAAIDGQEDAEITIESVTIDGKDYPITGETYRENEYGTAYCYAYTGGITDSEPIDFTGLGEWTEIELTISVKGVK